MSILRTHWLSENILFRLENKYTCMFLTPSCEIKQVSLKY